MLLTLQQLRDAREEGFTLIELLVVIVIIGVLAAIALPIFLNQQKAAIRAGMKSDLRSTVTAIQTMLVKYPTATDSRATGDTTPLLFEQVEAKAQLSVSDSKTEINITGEVVRVPNGDGLDRHETASWNEYAVSIANNSAHAAYIYNSKTGKTDITYEDNPTLEGYMSEGGYLLVTQK